MKERFLENAKKEYTPEKRMQGLAIEGILFLGILPFILIFLCPRLDRLWGIPSFSSGWLTVLPGVVLIAGGALLAWWTIYVQFTIGRGTPVPVMATQKLIIQPPYSYCRNPMVLGTILAYLGVAVLVGSLSGLGLVILGTALLLTYVRLLEEKEMLLRFGEAYEAYRKSTPFILPRLWGRK